MLVHFNVRFHFTQGAQRSRGFHAKLAKEQRRIVTKFIFISHRVSNISFHAGRAGEQRFTQSSQRSKEDILPISFH